MKDYFHTVNTVDLKARRENGQRADDDSWVSFWCLNRSRAKSVFRKGGGETDWLSPNQLKKKNK